MMTCAPAISPVVRSACQLVGKASSPRSAACRRPDSTASLRNAAAPGFGGEDRDLLTGGWNAHACRLGGYQQLAGGLCIGRKARHTHAPARERFGRAPRRSGLAMASTTAPAWR